LPFPLIVKVNYYLKSIDTWRSKQRLYLRK
jgi:hypothetical protein